MSSAQTLDVLVEERIETGKALEDGAFEIQLKLVGTDQKVDSDKVIRDYFANRETVYEMAKREHPVQMRVIRGLDIVLGATGLTLAAPVLASSYLVHLASCVYDGELKPFLFRQERRGLAGELFKVTKERTLEEGVESKWKNGHYSNGDHMHTIVPEERDYVFGGKWKRSLREDELLNFWDVLWGKMSIAGPRPLADNSWDGLIGRYGKRACRMLEVFSGILGRAQTREGYEENTDQRVEDSLAYVDEFSKSPLKTYLSEIGLSTARIGSKIAGRAYSVVANKLPK